MEQIPHRVWLEISLSKLKDNFQKIRRAVKPAKVLTVVKANAYGLGVMPVANALAEAGSAGFGVAEPREAMQLLPLGKPVQILSSVLPEEIGPMVEAGVTLPVMDWETARQISRAAVRLRKTATVQFKIDTGMGRLGILAKDAPEVIRRVVKLPNLDCEGMFSHFPQAYENGSGVTNRQMDLFCEILREVAGDGIQFRKCHIAASSGINSFPRAHKPPFNYVRAGIDLHGSFEPEGHALGMQPILTLKARIAQIRRLPANATVGYGLTCRLPRATRVATVTAGYADGFPLALSNRGYFLVHGIPCPILGRISMDYTVVSLEGVPQAKVGDEVVCIGGEGPNAIRVEDWASLKMTHGYDILCSFGNRVVRRYV